jgi:hypothetical protein
MAGRKGFDARRRQSFLSSALGLKPKQRPIKRVAGAPTLWAKRLIDKAGRQTTHLGLTSDVYNEWTLTSMSSIRFHGTVLKQKDPYLTTVIIYKKLCRVSALPCNKFSYGRKRQSSRILQVVTFLCLP